MSLANEGRSIPVPLYNLVYHDAVLTPSGGLLDPVRCALNGGYPKIERELDVEMAQRLSELHARIGLLEMTGHEFLDESFRKERSTFSDGTTVTIDRDAGTFEIYPPLPMDR